MGLKLSDGSKASPLAQAAVSLQLAANLRDQGVSAGGLLGKTLPFCSWIVPRVPSSGRCRAFEQTLSALALDTNLP